MTDHERKGECSDDLHPPSRTTEYRCMKHDMKQHCTVLLCLLEKQQYETAKEYLKNLIEKSDT